MDRIRLCTLTLAAAVFGAILVIRGPAATAADYIVDPDGIGPGRGEARGTVVRSLQALVDRRVLEPGDTVYLRSGFYGSLRIRGQRNSATVTIAAAAGHRPRLRGLQVRNSTNWRFRGLALSPSFAPPGVPSGTKKTWTPPIVELKGDVRNVTIEDSEIFSDPDIVGWSAADWRARAVHGIAAQGRDIVIGNNRIRNIRHGIQMFAAHALVEGNVIENFSGDGIRALGDYGTYRSNTVKNCYDVDDNHDDGIQSWSVGPFGVPGRGRVVGVVLSGNRIINTDDPNQPLLCFLQGIGLFDGMYEDWVIENNVVVVDNWHGITVMGAKNVRIVNNTVIDPRPGRPGPAWIRITAHKNGTPSEANVIANNIATAIPRSKGKPGSGALSGVTWSSNYVPRFPRAAFRDMPGLDFEPRPGSGAIDGGDARYAPKTDIRGVPRPQGRGVDIGAYETRAPGPSGAP